MIASGWRGCGWCFFFLILTFLHFSGFRQWTCIVALNSKDVKHDKEFDSGGESWCCLRSICPGLLARRSNLPPGQRGSFWAWNWRSRCQNRGCPCDPGRLSLRLGPSVVLPVEWGLVPCSTGCSKNRARAKPQKASGNSDRMSRNHQLMINCPEGQLAFRHLRKISAFLPGSPGNIFSPQRYRCS